MSGAPVAALAPCLPTFEQWHVDKYGAPFAGRFSAATHVMDFYLSLAQVTVLYAQDMAQCTHDAALEMTRQHLEDLPMK